MSKFSHNRLQRGIHCFESFGFVFKGGNQSIRQLQQLVVRLSRIEFGIAVHRKSNRFQVRKCTDHVFQRLAHLGTTGNRFTRRKPGIVQLGRRFRHLGFTLKRRINDILENIQADKALFTAQIRHRLHRKRQQQQDCKNNNKGNIEFLHVRKITKKKAGHRSNQRNTRIAIRTRV